MVHKGRRSDTFTYASGGVTSLVVPFEEGADIEATEKARSYFMGYEPSSPSIALLKDGELVYMMERRQIEGKDAWQVANELTQAFDQHCAKSEATAN